MKRLKPSLNDLRLRLAEGYFKRRKERNEEVDLADCLTLGDKAKIFAAVDDLRQLLEQEDVREIENFFKIMKDLRDDLAHAHDVIGKHWPGLVELVSRAETFLGRLEGTR